VGRHYWDGIPPIAGYLHRLAVRDGFHRRSIGTSALEWAMREVIQRGPTIAASERLTKASATITSERGSCQCAGRTLKKICGGRYLNAR
jgi:hypothetical protein